MQRPTRRRVFALGALSGAAAIALVAMTGTVTAASQEKPSNTTEPRITGTAEVGSTLTATQGAWTRNPTSFAFQWVRCPASGSSGSGSDCATIGGATTQSYIVANADNGARLRVRVTASNADGSSTAASNATAVITAGGPDKPARVADPRISGDARVGSTLSATQGEWKNKPTEYRYQWVRCPTSGGNPTGSDCASIGGATGQVYTLVSADKGYRMRVRVTAANSAGSATSASNATSVVEAATPAPAPTGCPAGSGVIQADEISPPARLTVDHQAMSPSPVRGNTDTLTVRFHVSACGGRSVQGMLVYVTAVPFSQFSIPPEAKTGGDGWAQLTMHRDRFFPASSRQQLLVMFVRARKSGEPMLGGISTRRLISFPVRLG